MIIINDDHGNIVKFSVSDTMTSYTDSYLRRIVHKIKLPTVIATNEKDARNIQRQINIFVNDLCHKAIRGELKDE